MTLLQVTENFRRLRRTELRFEIFSRNFELFIRLTSLFIEQNFLTNESPTFSFKIDIIDVATLNAHLNIYISLQF